MDEKKLQQQQQVRNTLFTIDKELPEYHAGIREGRRQERGNWVQVLSNTKEIDEVLLEQIIGEVAKLYETDG
ncbi:MAG: hypothetical protein ACOCG5_09470 [Candidatus Alkaliphilus sp. MAG34]